MNPKQRLQELESALERLRREAEGAGVLVEGRRDVQALDALGVGGQHRLLHRGRPLEEVIDSLANEATQQGWRAVIILLDWDRTGGRLTKRFAAALAGRVRVDLECRRRLARASHARCVEDVPSDLASLRQQTV